jgi:hypothetical protein
VGLGDGVWLAVGVGDGVGDGVGVGVGLGVGVAVGDGVLVGEAVSVMRGAPLGSAPCIAAARPQEITNGMVISSKTDVLRFMVYAP